MNDKLKMKILRYAVVAWTMIPFFAAAQKLTFTPQWTPQSQFAGYYAAAEKGFYRQAGLDVDIVHFSTSLNAVEMLKSGVSDIITCNLMEAMKQRDAGLPLVNILQTSMQSSMLIISHTPLDKGWLSLNGKRVGRWRAGYSAIASLVSREQELQIEWVDFLSGINLFMSGAVDATIAMSYNELFSIMETGTNVAENQLIRFADSGYNIPEDGVYVTESFFLKNREAVVRFAEATRKGWLWVKDHPEEATDIVMSVVRKHKIPTNRHHQRMMLAEILRLQCLPGETEPAFTLPEIQWDYLNALLLETGDIHKKIEYRNFIKQ
ncbi:MAG: ABC transporter substrate-binding protein [Tannerellaceae bacterium]|jgi:NitT/TauT family transport system substrate-binding protein|nr:ABC transporter substrate-binding protein [Tannerellaceae bacterium]